MDISKYIGSGTIVWNRQDFDPDKRLIDQMHELDEDIFAITYDNITVDLGWYGEHRTIDDEGHFTLMVYWGGDDYSAEFLSIDFKSISYIPFLLEQCAEFAGVLNSVHNENDVIRAD